MLSDLEEEEKSNYIKVIELNNCEYKISDGNIRCFSKDFFSLVKSAAYSLKHNKVADEMILGVFYDKVVFYGINFKCPDKRLHKYVCYIINKVSENSKVILIGNNVKRNLEGVNF